MTTNMLRNENEQQKGFVLHVRYRTPNPLFHQAMCMEIVFVCQTFTFNAKNETANVAAGVLKRLPGHAWWVFTSINI